MADKKRSLIPRKLKLVPAALLSVIILAVLSLLGLLNFTPPSLDSSSSEAAQEESEEAETETSQEALVSMDFNRPAEEPKVDEEAAMQPLDLVDVLIDGDTYWFGVGMRDEQIVRQQKTIGEIVTASQQSGGDASGVKIRVTRTFEATAQAERVLIEALSEAGLSDDEIDQRRTLVEQPSQLEP